MVKFIFNTTYEAHRKRYLRAYSTTKSIVHIHRYIRIDKERQLKIVEMSKVWGYFMQKNIVLLTTKQFLHTPHNIFEIITHFCNDLFLYTTEVRK